MSFILAPNNYFYTNNLFGKQRKQAY